MCRVDWGIWRDVHVSDRALQFYHYSTSGNPHVSMISPNFRMRKWDKQAFHVAKRSLPRMVRCFCACALASTGICHWDVTGRDRGWTHPDAEKLVANRKLWDYCWDNYNMIIGIPIGIAKKIPHTNWGLNGKMFELNGMEDFAANLVWWITRGYCYCTQSFWVV